MVRAGKRDRAARAYARPACVALERPLKTTGLREAQAGKRDRAPELMRGQPAWRLNAFIKQPASTARAGRQARPRARANARKACVALERLYISTGLRDAQAGKRDRAPELMRGKLGRRLNAL